MTVPLATICAHIRATLPDCTPASVAAHFAMSRFHLSRRFHRETGLPLRDYLAALKIEQGIAALVAQKPVIDSQLDAGHESAATYSHTFRAATGIAPPITATKLPPTAPPFLPNSPARSRAPSAITAMRHNNTRSHGCSPCASAAVRRGTPSSPASFPRPFRAALSCRSLIHNRS